MAANLSALLLDWAERGSECLSQRSAPLREQLPPDHYAKLCTSFLCLGRVLGGLPPVGGAAFPEGAPELYGAFARLVEVVLDACLCEAESRRSPSPAQRGGPSFEKVHEAYIACSLTVLDALVRHRYPVDAAAAAYSKLLGELDFNRIENAEVLVRTFSLLVAEKIPGDVGKATVRRLLDEIGARDLYDLPAELLCEVVRGCSVSSTQHVAALDAVCDAFLERSHQLPDLQTVVDLLASFRVLSYHNAAVLEMLVRHVHNNAESATAAQVSSVLESCVRFGLCLRLHVVLQGALQFNHPTLDELAREKPCP
ncbi:uncharacterized protein BcabD6B2_17070 [Babesia caballi]|uniref:Uncharacterized protein n=1 Tax=Babesia caballi TaxID=5871 RepID=A0AAV4LPS8_BABCB|nr:hypothetical protein BcabD6B2_17070 [Babesia caballi]